MIRFLLCLALLTGWGCKLSWAGGPEAETQTLRINWTTGLPDGVEDETHKIDVVVKDEGAIPPTFTTLQSWSNNTAIYVHDGSGPIYFNVVIYEPNGTIWKKGKEIYANDPVQTWQLRSMFPADPK